jgi:uncharacterized NAD-dependent epimerase/dehydratase family protein
MNRGTPSPAIVLANGGYRKSDGKVAHGLVRSGSRFGVLAVVDPVVAGEDAGEALDGVWRDVPIVGSLDEAIASVGETPEFCVIGVATLGGRLSDELRVEVGRAVERGMSIVNGLHDWLSDDPELASAAEEKGVQLIDLRKPPPRRELHFWSGEIYGVKAKRIAVLGMDCSIGKRTTTRMLVEALELNGLRTEMIYTGQTGWMQGAGYGLVFDSLPNDFVCGELEKAILDCDREVGPEVMVIEGQSALRNPSGPCGGEMLLSAAVAGVILQHAPGREFVEDFEELGLRIPPVEDEVELIRRYGVPTLAVALNGHGMSGEELIAEQNRLREKLGIPVIRPLEEGVGELIPVIRRLAK